MSAVRWLPTPDEQDAAIRALVAIVHLPNVNARMNAWALATKALLEGDLDAAIARAKGEEAPPWPY